MVSRVFSTRRQLAAVLVLVLAVLSVLAVQAVVNRPQTCTTTIPAEQDLQVALAYGAALESYDWKADYADHGDSISARWTDETGIGHLDYLRYNCGLTTADLDNYRFDISLGGYDSWEQLVECETDGLRLHEFAVVYDSDQDYRVRFWLQPVGDTRLAAFQLSLPAEREADMDTYAARLFPQLSTCA